MKSRLNWVVAFPEEAKVVINAFHLKRIEAKSDHYPVYESESGEVGLIVSGIGKVSAAAATMSLIETSEPEPGAVGWINFGIGGCSECRYGEPILASKITDEGTGRSWYPVPTWDRKRDLRRLPVTTVDRPVEDHSRNPGIVEMEASGFFPIALKRSSVELAQVLKVISDDPEHSVKDLSKDRVDGLCQAAWPSVLAWVEGFREVIESESLRLAEPPGYLEWELHYRFTATQRHQLRRLLQDWAALQPGTLPSVEAKGNPKEALQRLRGALSSLRESKNRI
ncbi:MAG: hypothetical protein AAF733_10405 [Verrucomicrobiota bacterium]